MKLITMFLMCALSLFAKPYEISPSVDENFGAIFKFNIQKDAFLYADKFNIILENSKKINEFINLPQSKIYKNDKIFDTNFSVIVPLGLVQDSQNFALLLEISACSKNGICFEPENIKFNFKKVGLDYKIVSKKLAQNSEISPNSSAQNLQNQNFLAQKISSQNFLLAIITFFGYGILLSLTPCVLPMIPILSSIIVAKNDSKHGFLISLIYVVSMAFAYAIAGILAAVFGANLQIFMQRPVVIIAFGLMFVLLGASMFGLFNIKTPLILQNFIDKKIRQRSGFLGVSIMGFFSALIVSPCVAAPLAGALLYIAQGGSVLLGGICLFAMGFAMGLPLLIIGLGSSKFLPKPGAWMNEISKFFAFVMFFMALFMISRLLDANLMLLLYGILGLFFGANLLPIYDELGFKKFRLSVGLGVIIYSTMLIFGFGSGAKSFLKPLENFSSKSASIAKNPALNFKQISNLSEINAIIKNEKKLVMLEFSASWCINCKELEQIFNDDDVKMRLENFVLLKVDISKNSPQNDEIMAKFAVFGAPTILFFNGENLEKRLVGLVTKEKFLEILDQI